MLRLASSSRSHSPATAGHGSIPPPTGSRDRPGEPRPRAPPRRRIRTTAPPDSRLGAGRPLSRHERDGFEPALEHDLSAVRLHTGPIAAGLADDRHALAFTYGTHIVLGADAQCAGHGRYDAVLAHELVHVVHQTGEPTRPDPCRSGTPARGPPCVPTLRTSVHAQDLWVPEFVKDAAGAAADLAGDVAGEVVDFGGDVVELGGDIAGGAVDAALYVGGLVLEGAEEVIDYLAPGLLPFLRGNVLELLEDIFCRGVDAVVSTLLGPLGDIDVMSGIEMFFRGLTAGVKAVYGALGTTASAAVGVLLRPVLVVIDLFGEDIVNFVQGLSDAVSAVFTTLWDNIALPVLQFLGAVGSWAWDAFKAMVTWVWDITEPLRDLAEWAWDWLLDQFGLVWESSAGVRTWLEEKAAAAWAKFLEVIEPIKTPLKVVGGILLMLSPLGPIVLLTQVLPPVWDKLKWLAANWQDTAVVVRAREILENDILPFLIGVVDSLKQLVAAAAAWLAGLVASVARGMQVILGLFSSSTCLTSVNRILEHVANQFDRLQAWAENGFAGLGPAIGALFEALRTIFQPILDFLVRLVLVAANPPLLPVALTGAIWLLLPDEFKPPVIAFVLGLLIAFLSGFPAFLTGLGPLAAVLKSATLGFLRHLKGGEGVDDKTRIDASNKMANLMAGGGPQFIVGYAIGLVHGLIEGIIDPFKLLFMLFELVVAAIRVLKRVLAPLVVSLAPAPVVAGIGSVESTVAVPAPVPVPVAGGGVAPPAEAAARAPPEPAAAPAPAVVAGGAVESAGGPAEGAPAATVVPTGGATAAATIESAPAADTAETGAGAATTTAEAGGGEGAAEEAIFAAEGVESDVQIARRLPPDVVADVVAGTEPEGVSADGLTAEMRTEVEATSGSVTSLASLLGEAWTWLMDASGRLGARIAVELLKLLALSDYTLGRKLGWLSGMILLEVLIAYFTAGGYTVLKQGASLGRRLLAYLLRFLDIGGEILGVLGRALAPLQGPILRGFGAAKGFLSRFGFIRGLFDSIEALARKIFRFGDEAAARAPGRVGGAAPAPRPGLPEPGAPAPRVGPPEARPSTPSARAPEPATAPVRAPEAHTRAPEPPARAAEPAAPASREAIPEPGAPAPHAPAQTAPPSPAGAPARAAGESAEAAGERAAREAMDAVPTRPGRDAAEELGDGSFRAVDEPGVPRVEDDAMKATQLAEAQVAARAVVRTNDVVDTPVPLVLGQLMVLKRRYRWIETFQAKAQGVGRYDFEMVASRFPIGSYTIEVNGRQVEVSHGRVGNGPEPAYRATPGDVLPPGPARTPPGPREIDPDVQRHIDELTGGVEQGVHGAPERELARKTARGEASPQAVTQGPAETHHVATQFGRRMREIFERAFGARRIRVGARSVHPIHHPVNLIEAFVEHRMFPGWWTNTGKYIPWGHHRGYHDWVIRHLRAALERPGLTQEQAFREFITMSLRLKRVIQANPQVLQHGLAGLPAHLHTLPF